MFVPVKLISNVCDRKLFLIFVMQSSSQPARLNVFKNDQDTWDYTNPNLSGQGNMQSPVLPSPFFFLFSSHATVWDGQGSLPPGVLPMIRVECFSQLSVQRQYSCDAFTIFMHFSTTQQAQSKGMRSNLEGSQPQLKLMHVRSPTRTHHSSIRRCTVLHIGSHSLRSMSQLHSLTSLHTLIQETLQRLSHLLAFFQT